MTSALTATFQICGCISYYMVCVPEGLEGSFQSLSCALLYLNSGAFYPTFIKGHHSDLGFKRTPLTLYLGVNVFLLQSLAISAHLL